MGTNDPVYQREYKQKHYAANKQKYIDQAAARRMILKAEIDDLKRKPCEDCGKSFNTWQMQFDHRGDVPKLGTIAHMIARCSRQRIMDEIAKCDLVCANCHADRTHNRRLTGV